MIKPNDFLKSRLIKQLGLSITAFIILIEGILLFASLHSRRVEFIELNKYAKNQVTQSLRIPSPEILTTENIDKRLHRFTLNIIGLTLIIIGVVVLGTLIVFYYIAGRHILKMVQINKETTKDNTVFYPPKEIPNNELGDLIISRDTLIRELADYQRVLLKDSMIDGLTTLYNKTYSERVLLNTVKLSLREQRIFTLLACDIDHFKKINDQYGHPVGDEVLTLVSKTLKEIARDTDVCGRIGGEEFMVILHACSIVGAKDYFERLSKNPALSNIMVKGKRIAVTLSAGAITFEQSWQKEIDPKKIVETLMSQADQALYYSKQNGRNRITHYELIPPTEALKAVG